MGSLTPILSNATLTGAAGAVNASKSSGNTRASQELALRQLQQQQHLREAQSAADAQRAREKVAIDAAADEAERQRALKRSVARQRANFGAQGVGSGQGSSQAVLLGLFDESEEEKSERESLDALRLNAIDDDLNQERALNVLQRTQLEERQKLTRSAEGGVFGTLF